MTATVAVTAEDFVTELHRPPMCYSWHFDCIALSGYCYHSRRAKVLASTAVSETFPVKDLEGNLNLNCWQLPAAPGTHLCVCVYICPSINQLPESIQLVVLYCYMHRGVPLPPAGNTRVCLASKEKPDDFWIPILSCQV
jgi:hypothetical protein